MSNSCANIGIFPDILSIFQRKTALGSFSSQVDNHDGNACNALSEYLPSAHDEPNTPQAIGGILPLHRE